MKKKGKGGTNMKPAKGPAPKSNIPGVEVMNESKSKSDGFKKGGGVSLKTGGGIGMKSGGMAEGDCAPGRADKPRRASGGAVNNRGRSPLSSASSLSPPASGGKSSGY